MIRLVERKLDGSKILFFSITDRMASLQLSAVVVGAFMAICLGALCTFRALVEALLRDGDRVDDRGEFARHRGLRD